MPTKATYPELAVEIDQIQRHELPAGWDRNLPVFPADSKGMAGREASGKVLNVLAQNIPWFLGGSADLEFFDVVSGARQVDWGYEPAGDTLLGHYLSLGVKKGDARICAQLHAAGVRWLISENRHFFGGIPHLPFTVLSAADALVELG